MIELLKAEEQKKQGGIGVAKAARLPSAAPQVKLIILPGFWVAEAAGLPLLHSK